MLKQGPFYRQFTAYLLALLFTAGWMLRATHEMLLHTDHTHAICEAAYQQDSNKHLHGSEYAPKQDCPICAVWFSAVTLVSPGTDLFSIACLPEKLDFLKHNAPDSRRFYAIVQLRGPPAF
jgi:hypothetical protein